MYGLWVILGAGVVVGVAFMAKSAWRLRLASQHAAEQWERSCDKGGLEEGKAGGGGPTAQSAPKVLPGAKAGKAEGRGRRQHQEGWERSSQSLPASLRAGPAI